jgi:hypothetical protein
VYGLPSDFDPTVFVGRELERITFGVNVIVLAFDGDLTVSVSSSLPATTLPARFGWTNLPSSPQRWCSSWAKS